MTSPDLERLLSPEFEKLAQIIGTDSDSRMSPERIVLVARRALPDAIGCAVTVTGPSGRPGTMASTGEVARAVDALQYSTREGPCLDSLDSDDAMLVDDLRIDGRWPNFARRCVAETPVRSMLSVRLALTGTDRAALNFVSDRTGGFNQLDLGVASMFAPFVALSVQSSLHEARAHNLEAALQSSRQIGIAMGILMARKLLTSEQAFELLREASQHLNRKLRDVAAEVELTGTMPEFKPHR